MPGFFNVTNTLKGELKIGVISLASGDTKQIYLNKNDEDILKGLTGIIKTHNATIMSAYGTDGKLVLRDVDPNDTYEGGGGGGGNIVSVNGKTGTVVLNASDVGALPSEYVPNWGDIVGIPNALTAQQAAGIASIRAIGTGANDAAAGNHAHPILADSGSGLASSSNLQSAFVTMSSRVRAIERPTVRVITTSITLADTDTNTVIRCENSSDIVITIPSTLFELFNCGILRWGTGAVALTPGAGAILRGGSLAAISAQYRMASILVGRNSDGNSAEYKASETAS